ncbi:MAG: vWA domain-containing protein [Bacteroidia bacterium]
MKKSLISILLLPFLFVACSEDAENLGVTQRSFENSSDYEAGPGYTDPNGKYNEIVENPFIKTKDENVSTFSIDADGASYSNVRKHLVDYETLPPADAIRTEELINYFDFDYPAPTGSDPISVNIEMAETPWNNDHRLLRIGLKGKVIPENELPTGNYVFLVDVSGSMNSEDKLGLVQYGLNKMVDELDDNDQVGLVTYASNPRTVLAPTKAKDSRTIKNAIDDLSSGGSTNGEGGITTAYALAEEHFIEGGNNRIVLCTDGDFNVGISNENELVKLIEQYRDKNIFLTVVSVGHSYNDAAMEQLANKGNGTFEYADSEKQAERVFAQKLSRMLTVAKDVKIQVEFNPNAVAQYRLIGYENRLLENEDFEDDTKDAGEIGMGQTITALYEVVTVNNAAKNQSSLTFNFRYKDPEGTSSKEISTTYIDKYGSFNNASNEFRFAAAVASWGLVLRDSDYKGNATYSDIEKWAKGAIGQDSDGSRSEFIDLVGLSQKFDD